MKGFKDSNNKFHPITQSKGVRKSRDQSTKTEGIRLKRKNSPRIPFKTLDNTENQLYRIRDELSDQMEQETWSEVNELIDKIQNYKMKYYGRTGIRKARFTEDDKRILTGVIDDFNDLIEELDNFKAIDNNEKQNLERTNQILREVRDKRLDKLDKPEIESDFRV